MSIETMKLALEALERNDYLGWQVNKPAITALRQAIEQAEQAQPVAVEFPRQVPQKECGWRLDTSFIWRVLHTIAPDEPAEFIPSPEQIENTLLALERIPSNLYTAPPPRQPEQAKGYAGVTVWGGDRTITKVLTETEMQNARNPRVLMANVVSQCLDELAAHGIKENT